MAEQPKQPKQHKQHKQHNHGFFWRNPRREEDSSWRRRQGRRQNHSRDCPLRPRFTASGRSDWGSQKVKFVRDPAFL